MSESLEIRWFFTHEKGLEKALDWYNTIGGNNTNPESSRIDYYLNHFSNGTLSTKLREGQLEIKQKLPLSLKHNMPFRDNGVIEIYNKCEFIIASNDIFSTQIILKKNHEHWIAVTKKRKLLKVTANALTVLPGSTIIDDGCSVEITRLSVQNKHWWTFCVEAYAKRHDIADNMKKILEYISDTFKKSDELFKLKASMGYPAWLMMQLK